MNPYFSWIKNVLTHDSTRPDIIEDTQVMSSGICGSRESSYSIITQKVRLVGFWTLILKIIFKFHFFRANLLSIINK